MGICGSRLPQKPSQTTFHTSNIHILYMYRISIRSFFNRCCHIESGDGGALKRFHHKAENLPGEAKTIKNIAENRTKG